MTAVGRAGAGRVGFASTPEIARADRSGGQVDRTEVVVRGIEREDGAERMKRALDVILGDRAPTIVGDRTSHEAA